MNPDESNSNVTRSVAPVVPGPAPLDFSDPKLRRKLRDEVRAEEWAMHRELMAAARIVLKNFYENPQKSTVPDLARIIDLSSKLGRLATASDNDLTASETDTTTVMIEFKAALQKVYARRQSGNRPLPAGAVEVIDAETLVEQSSLSPSISLPASAGGNGVHPEAVSSHPGEKAP